jgi:hypothetical protein
LEVNTVACCTAVYKYLLEHFRMNIKTSAKTPDGATEVRIYFLPSINPSVTTAQTCSLPTGRRDSDNNARHMSESYFITCTILMKLGRFIGIVLEQLLAA